MLDILIVRDPREPWRKCSLAPLRGMEGVRFVAYRPDRRIDAGARVLLHPDGELLSERDRGAPLLVVDCAWRRLPTLLRTIDGEVRPRRLPPFATAYPRASKLFEDPEQGLASLEALYAASVVLGEPWPALLDRYPWRERFLELNPPLQPR